MWRYLLLAWLGSAGLAEAQVTLGPDDARLAAARLLAAGQYAQAADITTVLIARDGEDAASLILHAHGMRNLRRHDAAQEAARRAWQAADRDLDRYGAALAMAQALSSDGHQTRAQFWLRRAAHVAPAPQMRARAIRDYGFVRKINPWSVSLSFGITPSDNVNNAPRDNTIVLGGLVFTNPSAVPVSGLEVQTDTTLRYNFAEATRHRNFAALRWTESHVVFTDDTVPAGVRASDFSYRRLEGTLGRDFIAGPGAPRQTVSVSFGRLWTGDSPLADEMRLEWRQLYDRPQGRQFAWNATLGYSDRQDNDLRSGVTAGLGAQWHRPLESGGRLSWDASLSRTDTDSRAVTHTAAGAGVRYVHGAPVMGAQAEVALSAKLSQYDDPLYSAEARRDLRTTLSTSLLFVDFDTYGFAPRVTLEASRTNSNVTRFETRNLGLRMGFQSLF
jgi:hypothetical protein